MKKLIIISAAHTTLPISLHAQTLNVTAPGFSGTKLFDSNAGFTITGIAADTNGDIYYLETDGSFHRGHPTLQAHGGQRFHAAPAAPLFDLGGAVFGSFVTLGGGKVFFGESSTNKIYAINPDGSGSNTLGTVVDRNFDAAYAAGNLFVSNNVETNFQNPPKNRVSGIHPHTG